MNRQSIKAVTALVIRAVGLVALAIGLAVLCRWALFELMGGSRSGPSRAIYATVGPVCTALGVLCRIIAARLLREA